MVRLQRGHGRRFADKHHSERLRSTDVGHSPALSVHSGTILVTGVTFTSETDSPTMEVSGGSLYLRDCDIEESTGFNQAAISITGGSVDLGTPDDPGGNTMNVNGT